MKALSRLTLMLSILIAGMVVSGAFLYRLAERHDPDPTSSVQTPTREAINNAVARLIQAGRAEEVYAFYGRDVGDPLKASLYVNAAIVNNAPIDLIIALGSFESGHIVGMIKGPNENGSFDVGNMQLNSITYKQYTIAELHGFNSGSAVAADVVAANAFTTTTIATAVASFVWPMWEWIVKGRPSVLGFCSGAVAGLVVITPACGFVTPQGSIWIGIAAGTIPWFFCYKVKGWFGYDDALDTFGVHGIGGLTGALMTGMLARNAANPNLATNLKGYVTDSWFQPLVWEQIKAIGVTLALAIVGTILIAYITKALVGLRPTEEVEIAGLDINEHGEEGYHA